MLTTDTSTLKGIKMKLYIMTLTNSLTGNIEYAASSTAPLRKNCIMPEVVEGLPIIDAGTGLPIPPLTFRCEEFEIETGNNGFARGRDLMENILEVRGNRVMPKTGKPDFVIGRRLPMRDFKEARAEEF